MGAVVRLLHGADLHLGLRRFGTPTRSGNSRVEDFAATIHRFAATAIDREVDLAVLAGDTFDNRTPTPYELAAVSRAVTTLRSAGIALVVLPGNHDGPETVGAPDTHTLAWMQALALDGVWVPLVPSARRIETGRVAVDVTAIPYPHKRALDAELEGVPPELRVIEAARRVDALIEAQRPSPVRSVPAVLIGHLTITGSRLGSERMMRSGWDVTIDAGLLEAWDYAALGHIHLQQQVNAKAWYAGSMEYIDHGEAGTPKGWLLVEVNAGGDPVVQPIPSGARPLGTLTIEQEADVPLTDPSPASWYEAGPIIHVRMVCRYHRPSAAEQDRIRAGVLAKGASFVDTEIVLEGDAAEYRATRPEVDAAVQEVLAVQSDESTSEGERQPATVADLSRTDALRVWLMANKKPLEPTLTIGAQMIAAQTAEGEPG